VLARAVHGQAYGSCVFDLVIESHISLFLLLSHGGEHIVDEMESVRVIGILCGIHFIIVLVCFVVDLLPLNEFAC